jgi:hypothetical protein
MLRCGAAMPQKQNQPSFVFIYLRTMIGVSPFAAHVYQNTRGGYPNSRSSVTFAARQPAKSLTLPAAMDDHAATGLRELTTRPAPMEHGGLHDRPN